MAVSENTGGTVTTDGTEQTLATITAAGTYVLAIDTTNMINGTIIELRIKTKVRSASTAYLAYYAVYANIQSEIVKYSVPVPSPFSIAATIKRVGGSDYGYIWSIYAL